MSSNSTTCPHCGESTPDSGMFCESCGKALPMSTPSRPKIVTGAATTSGGRRFVKKSLEQEMKKAFTALMVVAVLQTLAGPILLFLQKEMNPNMQEIPPFAYGIVFGIAIAFWILAFWARKSPLPAAIVGLVLFVSLHVLDAVADPTKIAQGILMKIIIVVMLVRAIQAALKYRQTIAEQSDPNLDAA